MQKIISLVVFFVVMIFGVAIAIINTDIVNFNYYLGTVSVPLSLLVVSVFIAGAVFALVLSWLMVWSLRLRLRSSQSRLQKYEVDQVNLIKAINR